MYKEAATSEQTPDEVLTEDTEKESLEKRLEHLINMDGEKVKFTIKDKITLQDKEFDVAVCRKSIDNGSCDLIVFGIWDSGGEPAAYLDCIYIKSDNEVVIDIKNRNTLFPDRSVLFKTLDTMYEESDKKNGKDESAFYVRRDYRGKGVAQALLAQAVYVLEKHGAETITVPGDTTVEKDGDGNFKSLYASHSPEFKIDMDPVYPDGAPYNGPETTFKARLDEYQRDLLSKIF